MKRASCFSLFSILFFLIFIQSAASQQKDIIITYVDAQIMALKSSDDLEIAALGLTLAGQKLKLSNRIYFPRVSVGYKDANSVITGSSDNRQHQLSLSVEQLIFDGGTTAAQQELSFIQLDIEKRGLKLKQEELMDNVWNIYHSILILQEKIKIQKQNFQLAEDQLLIVETQLRLGAIREIDFIETKLQITSLSQGISETEYQLDDAMLSFKQMISVPSEITVILEESINNSYNGTAITVGVDIIYALALKNSAQLYSMNAQLLQKQKELEFSSRTYIPQISGTFSLNFSGEAFPLGSPSINAGIRIAFPDRLFPLSTSFNLSSSKNSSTLSTDNNLGIAEDFSAPLTKTEIKTGLQYLGEQKKLFLKNLYTEIERSFRAFENMRERIGIRRSSLELQKRKLEINEKQLELGEITSLDVLKTRSELVSTETEMLEQVLAIMQAERGLEKLIGQPPGTFSIFYSNQIENEFSDKEDMEHSDND